MTDRKSWRTGLSIGPVSEEKLKRASLAGIELVEVSGIEGEAGDWKKIPAWSRETGVELWSVHLPFDWNIPIDPSSWDPDWWKKCYDADTELIKRASEGGARIAVIHASLEKNSGYIRNSILYAAIAHLGVLAEAAKHCGVTLAVENLPRTCLGNCSDEIEAFLLAIPELRVCFDVNHLLQEDHTSFIARVGGSIVTTHISDYDFEDEKHWMPTDGKIDWKKLQEDLERADYSGPFLYETGWDSVDWADVKKNHEMLKKL